MWFRKFIDRWCNSSTSVSKTDGAGAVPARSANDQSLDGLVFYLVKKEEPLTYELRRVNFGNAITRGRQIYFGSYEEFVEEYFEELL